MRKRLRSHEGANAVEFALVLPLLIMLLFGAVTFGLAFNAKQQLTHANREAVRFAATLSGPGTTTFYEDVFDRIFATAVDQASPQDPSLTICVSVTTDDAGTVESLTATGGHPDTSTMVASGSPGSSHCHDTSIGGPTVQVTIRRGARLDAVFFRRDITIPTAGVARYEVAL